MMMEKPSAAAAARSRPKEQPEKSPPQQQQTKKKSAEEAVAELEQRLAALGGPSPVVEEEEVAVPDLLSMPTSTVPAPAPPAPFAPPPPVTQQPAATQVKGGKNALLARIMAAQEKTKVAVPPPPSISQQGPSPMANVNTPPPAYDAGLIAPFDPPPTIPTMMRMEPPQPPPPAFDDIQHSVVPQFVAHEPPPSYFMPPPPPAASAPAFEDLMDQFDEPPPPVYLAPPPPTAEEEFIMGMEGLSPEERSALLEEQRKIMEQIERDKIANKSAIAAVQADNFDMRSTAHALTAVGSNRAPTTRPPAGAATGSKVDLGGGQEVPLHGPERTQEAIKDGTAILVQCVNCENWMQVTGNATLMYCPVCAVVSPIDHTTAAMSKEEAMQMEADRKMAEQLQNEEYEAADRPQRRARQAASTAAEAPKPAQQEGSWWDTVTGMFSTETKESAPPVPSSSSQAYSPDERQSLTGGAGSRPAARVAQRQPLFSCVVDSVNSTVGTLTGTNLSQDQDGNVHGVDSTSLLAVSNVGRDTDYQQFNNSN